MVTVASTARESGLRRFSRPDRRRKIAEQLSRQNFSGRSATDLSEDCPVIILLSGGVNNGGDSMSVPQRPAAGRKRSPGDLCQIWIPIIYAGNEDVTDEVLDIFHRHQIDARATKNIMLECQ